MKKMEKYKKKILVTILVQVIFVVQACIPAVETPTEIPQASSTLDEPSTLTATPEAPTKLPTATKTPISNTPTPVLMPTQARKVVFSVSGGNLSVRRGPRLTYNYVGVMYDGDEAIAIGRDSTGDWLLIELPSKPGVEGWVTTETKYSTVEGIIRSLPLVEVELPAPAFIRNCTKHKILVQPGDVELLNKYNAPDNEASFVVMTYQIYDVDISGDVRLEDVSLSEGRTVDIIYDGNGDKSKCE